jgi:uncharacterized protein YdeI (YjbR/CyaY-like superfamily)
MRPAALAAAERAKADGTWGSAYSGQAASEVPSDLASALAAHPAAQETFDNLSRANRYGVLYRFETVFCRVGRAGPPGDVGEPPV